MTAIDRLVGRIALGTAGMSFGGRANRDDDIAALRAGLAAGATILDTARAYAHEDDPFFGEELTAEAAGASGVLIGTKGGHARVGEAEWDVDVSPDRLRSDVEGSLRVFATEQLDLFYLHRADRAGDAFETAVATLGDLREEGKIARVGLSNVSVTQLDAAIRITRIDAVQNPHGVISRESAASLAWCETHEVAFFAYSPLSSSQGESPNVDAVARIRGVSRERLLLRGLLASSPVLSVVTGATRPATVLDSVAAEIEPWDGALEHALSLDLERRAVAREQGA